MPSSLPASLDTAWFQDRLVLLFVPGHRPDRFAKAVATGADGVIIDLEDAVAIAEKAAARDAIAGGFPTEGRIFLRVNARTAPWHGEDLALAARLPLAGLILPKTDGPEDVEAVAVALGRPLPIIPLIETARGLVAARAIAAMPQVPRLAFGSIDFAAEMGCDHAREPLLAARSELVLAARLAGQAGPIDGVTIEVGDEALAQDDAAYSARLGLAGKLCIHPKQVAPAIRGFRPTAEELAWARRIIDSLPAGGAVVTVDGLMVDAPVRLRAERILARAD